MRLDHLITHGNDVIHGKFCGRMGIHHHSLINAIALMGTCSFNGQQLHIDIGADVYKRQVLSRSSMENRIKNRDYDLALVGVNLSEVPNLYELLSSKGSLNMNRYSSDEMDSLLSQAGSAATEAELLQIYSQIQMIVVDRLPIMGLLFRTGTVLSSRSIGGMYGLRAYDNFNGFEFLTMD